MNGLQITTTGAYIQPTDSMERLAESWLTFLDAAPKTVQTYTRNIKQFLVFLQDNEVTQPQRADVVAFRDKLAKENKSAATIRGYITAVKLFFAWLAQDGRYPNIAEHVKSPKVQQYFHKDHLTTRQARNLLNDCDRTTAHGARDYAIMVLMATTGLRTIEVVRANIEDIVTIGDSTALFIQGKGRDDKGEYVKLSPEVEDAIRAYLSYRKESKTGALFVSDANRNKGERMTTRSVSRICKEHLVDIGLNSDRLTAHSLRHTAAHLMIKAGENIRNVQQVLRHSNINTTMIYLKQKNREDNNAESKAANLLFGKDVL